MEDIIADEQGSKCGNFRFSLEGFEDVWKSFVEITCKEQPPEILFCHLRLHMPGFEYLMEQWQKEQQQQKQQQQKQKQEREQRSLGQEVVTPSSQPHHRIEKVSFKTCSFGVDDEEVSSLQALIRFLQQLGSGLKELYVEDFPFDDYFILKPTSLIRLLRDLRQVSALERLAVVSANLQGMEIGLSFQDLFNSGSTISNSPNNTFLSSSSSSCSKLCELDFSFCRIDDDMLEGFLNGLPSLTSHLRRLDIHYWKLKDHQLQQLVDVLLLRGDEKEFKCNNKNSNRRNDALILLNLSQQHITAHSFPILARILDQFNALESLTLMGCSRLFTVNDDNDDNHNDDSDSNNILWETRTTIERSMPLDHVPLYLTFTRSLARNQTLTVLNLCDCGLDNDQALPLFQALETSSIQTLDVSSNEVLSTSLVTSLPHLQSLQVLHATLDLDDSYLRRALDRNTSLIQVWKRAFFCVAPYEDVHLHRILCRNRQIKKAKQFVAAMASMIDDMSTRDNNMNNNHGTPVLCATNWPLCIEHLMMMAEDRSCTGGVGFFFCSGKNNRGSPFGGEEESATTNPATNPSTKAGGDVSAAYAFVLATNLELLSWRKESHTSSS